MLYGIALGAAVLIYAVIVLLGGRGASARDTVRGRVDEMDRQMRRSLPADDEMNRPLSERLFKPLLHGVGQFFGRLLPLNSRSRANDSRLKRTLEMAGWSMSVDDYLALQLTLMLGTALAGLLAGAVLRLDAGRMLFLFAGGAFGSYAVLRYFVAARGTARRSAIEQQLPDMLDLLSVSVEAGLGFEQALYHITENMEGPLVDEVAVTYREMSMGRSRRDALLLLGERCDVADVQSFASALVQAGQLGIPIRNVLQAQSAAIRRSRRSKVQEKAAKVSTKILIPMLIFIFPVLFIVLLGPSMLTIMETLG